jgi:hypothetical protein
MNSARPELIFLAGPQQGERAVLMTNAALLGRSAAADVRIREDAASREHVRFQLTAEGWLMENLSANGTVVNGKRYKKKKLLLDTGDVLLVGLETQMLYVSPEDDPEEAFAAYREAHPTANAPAAPARADDAQAATAAPPAPAGREAPEKPKAKAAEEAADAAAAVEAEEEGSKKLKYILFGVILVGTVALGLAMIVSSLREDEEGGPVGLPRLTDAEITRALSEPIYRTPSRTKAAETLERAVRSYRNRALWEPGDLYRCVRDFKLHRAYRQSRSFAKIEHERMAEKALKELDALVREKYDAAWKFEKAKSWRNAEAAFEELLVVLRVEELDKQGPIYKVIIRGNVIQHLNYIKRSMGGVRGY